MARGLMSAYSQTPVSPLFSFFPLQMSVNPTVITSQMSQVTTTRPLGLSLLMTSLQLITSGLLARQSLIFT